jgi:hypothetical protein
MPAQGGAREVLCQQIAEKRLKAFHHSLAGGNVAVVV